MIGRIKLSPTPSSTAAMIPRPTIAPVSFGSYSRTLTNASSFRAAKREGNQALAYERLYLHRYSRLGRINPFISISALSRREGRGLGAPNDM